MLFFFYKQKTAYEMRISDWSSYVCSSDLRRVLENFQPGIGQRPGDPRRAVRGQLVMHAAEHEHRLLHPGEIGDPVPALEVADRSEERRVGQECVSTCRSR